MSKFECTNSRCIYGCKLEVNGQKKAPEKCQYTGMETHWVRVESEQFGNSEQLPKLTVRFKKLHPDAKAPYQATPGSAGWDLTATSVEPVKEDAFLCRYGTGLAVEIPAGHVGLVFPRSSVYKTGQLLTNCVGVIDSDYRGEITAVFAGTRTDNAYQPGDRIAQLVIMPIPAVKFEEAEELTETERGAGGYGSTGK
jgi:dUTP pyrophosphatase